MVLSKLLVTFTECSSASALLVAALRSFAGDSEVVLDKFADAHVSEGHSRAFLAVLVLFADSIKLVDWRTVARIGHWSITEDQALATVSPVFSLVEFGVVIFHLRSELFVSSGSLVKGSLSTSSGKGQVGGSGGEKGEDGGRVFHFLENFLKKIF